MIPLLTVDPIEWRILLAHLQVLFKQAFTLHQLVVFLPAPRLMGFLPPQHLGQSSLLAPGFHLTVSTERQR